jgi:glycosyltransferase involved in cell wall biosynthesis
VTTVAYLSNQFPCRVEPYVVDEIRELQRRGVRVIVCSARRVSPKSIDASLRQIQSQTLYLLPPRPKAAAYATYLCIRKARVFADLFKRVILTGGESPVRRAKALLHIWLGVYYALLLEKRGVQHIHVHHGYFGAWIAMVAARLLNVDFSMTLHGSDLLVHRAYLDTKLKNCAFCVTISAFNRARILENYPDVPESKIIVKRMGVEFPRTLAFAQTTPRLGTEDGCEGPMILLSVGRLHAVKNHAFLIKACCKLKTRGRDVICLIVGEGSERPALTQQIERLGLQLNVELLGALPHEWLSHYYQIADIVVLTSLSEGIPLVLMEAMAHQRTVLAPAITGIPELVEHGKTGFLYRPGSLQDFVNQIEEIWESRSQHNGLRRAARQHVLTHYNRSTNLAAFADTFLARVLGKANNQAHENPLLQ